MNVEQVLLDLLLELGDEGPQKLKELMAKDLNLLRAYAPAVRFYYLQRQKNGKIYFVDFLSHQSLGAVIPYWYDHSKYEWFISNLYYLTASKKKSRGQNKNIDKAIERVKSILEKQGYTEIQPPENQRGL